MTKFIFSTITILIAAAFISCNTAEKPVATDETSKPTFDLTNAKKEIEDINRTFMEFIAKGDSVGLANLYTTDAKLMFGGAPSDVGRANIQTAFAKVINSGVTKADMKTTAVFGTEELLAEEGEVTIYVKETAVANEKYIVLWKKEDSKWKLFRDISNSNSPPPASK